MNGFFKLLFGGLVAISVGVGIGWMVKKAIWTVTFPKTTEESLLASAEIFPAKPSNQISAIGYIMKDLTRNTVVAQSNSDKLLPIASLTKLITAEVAHKLIPASTKISISQDVIDTYGNTADFHVGEVFTAGDLIYPLLMVSSNDAAEAFAQQYGETRFIEAMNDFAQSMGAYRTYFADASGLSPQNESTANDITTILNWIRVNDPTILGITELKTKTIRNHTWVNPAHFLSFSYYIGGKNGYTDEADNTTASLFVLGQHQDVYSIVLLGSSNRDGDVSALLKKVQ